MVGAFIKAIFYHCVISASDVLAASGALARA
jgi:hypothetical protein